MEQRQTKNGVILLIVLSVIAKAIGVFYRIPLFAVLGANGIGLYQLVFPVYALTVAFFSGTTVSLSSSVAQKHEQNDREGIEKTTDTALVIFGGVGLLVALLLTLFSQYVSVFLGNSDAFWAIIAIAPSVFFSSVISLMRGYYQGNGRTWVVGVSFLSEQVLKLSGVIVALLFSCFLPTFTVMGAMLGITIGEAVTAIVLVVGYLKSKAYPLKPVLSELKRLLPRTVAVSLGALILPLSTFFDSAIIVNVLSGYVLKDQATALYGLLTGVVNPLISMPAVITSSFCSWLLPKLCKTSVKNRRATFGAYAKYPLALSLIIAVCVFFFAELILSVLYPLSGTERSVSESLLKVGSPIIFIACALALTTVYLQSLDKAHLPTINLFVATVLKVILTPIAVKTFSVYGAQACAVISYLIAFVLGCFQSLKYGFGFSLKTLFTVVLSALSFLFFAGAIYLLVPTLLGCGVGVVCGLSVACIVIVRLHVPAFDGFLPEKLTNTHLKPR